MPAAMKNKTAKIMASLIAFLMMAMTRLDSEKISGGRKKCIYCTGRYTKIQQTGRQRIVYATAFYREDLKRMVVGS